MPVINNVKTESAEKVWSSPDGQKTIFKVVLDVNGTKAEAKTYSGAVATVGFSGDVETYEKQGRNGTETFVKQPQKEGFTPRSFGGGSKPSSDNFTMYLSYAKDLAVALQQTTGFDQKAFDELLSAVSAGGKRLYESRVGAPTETVSAPTEKLDEVVTDIDEPLDLSNIDAIFGK